jgi:hypothetical protein
MSKRETTKGGREMGRKLLTVLVVLLCLGIGVANATDPIDPNAPWLGIIDVTPAWASRWLPYASNVQIMDYAGNQMIQASRAGTYQFMSGEKMVDVMFYDASSRSFLRMGHVTYGTNGNPLYQTSVNAKGDIIAITLYDNLGRAFITLTHTTYKENEDATLANLTNADIMEIRGYLLAGANNNDGVFYIQNDGTILTRRPTAAQEENVVSQVAIQNVAISMTTVLNGNLEQLLQYFYRTVTPENFQNGFGLSYLWLSPGGDELQYLDDNGNIQSIKLLDDNGNLNPIFYVTRESGSITVYVNADGEYSATAKEGYTARSFTYNEVMSMLRGSMQLFMENILTAADQSLAQVNENVLNIGIGQTNLDQYGNDFFTMTLATQLFQTLYTNMNWNTGVYSDQQDRIGAWTIEEQVKFMRVIKEAIKARKNNPNASTITFTIDWAGDGSSTDGDHQYDDVTYTLTLNGMTVSGWSTDDDGNHARYSHNYFSGGQIVTDSDTGEVTNDYHVLFRLRLLAGGNLGLDYARSFEAGSDPDNVAAGDWSMNLETHPGWAAEVIDVAEWRYRSGNGGSSNIDNLGIDMRNTIQDSPLYHIATQSYVISVTPTNRVFMFSISGQDPTIQMLQHLSPIGVGAHADPQVSGTVVGQNGNTFQVAVNAWVDTNGTVHLNRDYFTALTGQDVDQNGIADDVDLRTRLGDRLLIEDEPMIVNVVINAEGVGREQQAVIEQAFIDAQENGSTITFYGLDVSPDGLMVECLGLGWGPAEMDALELIV